MVPGHRQSRLDRDRSQALAPDLAIERNAALAIQRPTPASVRLKRPRQCPSIAASIAGKSLVARRVLLAADRDSRRARALAAAPPTARREEERRVEPHSARNGRVCRPRDEPAGRARRSRRRHRPGGGRSPPAAPHRCPRLQERQQPAHPRAREAGSPFIGSSTGVRPAARDGRGKPAPRHVEERPRERRCRPLRIAGRMAARPKTPAPRTSRIRNVSAWSSLVVGGERGGSRPPRVPRRSADDSARHAPRPRCRSPAADPPSVARAPSCRAPRGDRATTGSPPRADRGRRPMIDGEHDSVGPRRAPPPAVDEDRGGPASRRRPRPRARSRDAPASRQRTASS